MGYSPEIEALGGEGGTQFLTPGGHVGEGIGAAAKVHPKNRMKSQQRALRIAGGAG